MQRCHEALVDLDSARRHHPELSCSCNLVEPFRKFALARLSGERGVPPEVVDGVTYASIAEAEWDIFKRRWQELTGRELDVPDP